MYIYIYIYVYLFNVCIYTYIYVYICRSCGSFLRHRRVHEEAEDDRPEGAVLLRIGIAGYRDA